jgi:hypothetical protein
MLIFALLAFATLAAAGVLVLCILLGAGLCFSRRFRRIGIFLSIVPSVAVAAGIGFSWGAAFVVDALSARAASPEAFERWQILALWIWAAGFVVGGIVGAIAGLAIAILVTRRMSRRQRTDVIPQWN